MRRRWLRLLLLTTATLVAQQGRAQTTFDVKTAFEVKEALRVVKHGVSQSLMASSWARVAEVGENYSLWLTGLSRRAEGDSIVSTLHFEARTPAMISRGQLLATGVVSVTFAASDGQQYIDPGFAASFMAQQRANIAWLQVSSRLFMAQTGGLEQFLIRGIVNAYAREYAAAPQAWQVLEARLLGERVMLDLAEWRGVPLGAPTTPEAPAWPVGEEGTDARQRQEMLKHGKGQRID